MAKQTQPQTTNSAHERLVVFIYLLARDSVAFGELTKALHEAKKLGDTKALFTNKYMEGFARDLIYRLIQDEPDAAQQ